MSDDLDITLIIKRFFYEFRRKQVVAHRQAIDRLEAAMREKQPRAPFQPLDQRSLNSLYMPWTMACWANQNDDPNQT